MWKLGRPKRPVSILCRSPMKLLQVPAQLHSFPGISSALGSPPQTPRGEETGNKGSTERSSLGFCFFRGGGEGEGLRRPPPPNTHTPWRTGPGEGEHQAISRAARVYTGSRCAADTLQVWAGARGRGVLREKDPRPGGLFVFTGLGVVFIARSNL